MTTQVVFKNGYTWDTIPTAKARKIIYSSELLSDVARIRREWMIDSEIPEDVRHAVSLVLTEVIELIGG